MPGNTLQERQETGQPNAASMRPQRNAGEYREHGCEVLYVDSRFNEAPAKCRGIRNVSKPSLVRSLRFNEAPAKCRGIQQRQLACS